MKKKILFIINPFSGTGKQRGIEQLILQKLAHSIFEHEITYTKAPGHATELARNAVAGNFDIVAAIGGDGLLNEVGRGLTGTNSAMAILPAGSGNGFAHHLKIPMNLKDAMEVINKGKIISIDTVRINNGSYIGIAGVGLDAHIAWEFAHLGKRGFGSYFKVFLREYPAYKPQEYTIVLDGKTITRKALLVSFANSSQYGNNAVIAPGADMQDGVIEVCILKDFPFISFPRLAWQLFNKGIHRSKYLEILKAKEIIIKQTADIAHIDGEPVIPGKELRLNINPLSLKIVTP
ncbi:MAG TPA: diacylglycerol kinase family protein [Thermodesulfovibrionia bacterium]|nr:diacylglycerol kinase family protein [Thermodesulfovibrionia bacterium]